jgi:tetratricopeptide (TPR) repeat protein
MTESRHPNEFRVWSMTNLGDLYRQNGRYREAEALLRQALATAEQVFGPNDPNVLVILNNLAVLYKCIGEFDEAEQLYKRALAMIEREPEVDDEKVATLYHNLGGLEHTRGRYAEGELLARRSVQLREGTLGPNHVELAADLAALLRSLTVRVSMMNRNHFIGVHSPFLSGRMEGNTTKSR